MKIEILTSPGCAKCRLAEKRIRDVIGGLAEKSIQVSSVDITENPEIARKHMLFSTPGIVINGELAFAGMPKVEELRRKILGQL